MEKYLFTDGITGVQEAHSREELQTLIADSLQPDKIRIWKFSSNEWISYPAFLKQYPLIAKKQLAYTTTGNNLPLRTSPSKKWLKKFLFLSVVIASGFLVTNFTRIRWEKAGTINYSQIRPANMPLMNMDSLIWVLEEQRGQKLDRSTRTNLRLRNTWPERILLQLEADRETSRNDGSRFSSIGLSIDNTTGFQVDNAIVKLTVWKDNKVNTTDTFRFNNIGYEKMSKRELNKIYRGDSISVSFESIRARSFNFCYSSATKNEDNHYDKWFCKD